MTTNLSDPMEYFFRHLDTAAIIIDGSKKLIVKDANKKFYHISGLQEKDVLHKSFDKLTGKNFDLPDRNLLGMKKSLELVKLMDQYYILEKKGPVNNLYFFLFYPVSENGQGKEKLEEYINELRKLAHVTEKNPIGIVFTDNNGKIEYVNEKLATVSGYSRKEIIGKNPRILQSGFHDKEFYKELWDTISNGKTWSGTFKNRKKNGEIYWEKAAISPLKDDDGKIINYIGMKEDVTDQRLAEESLRESEENLKLLFEKMTDGFAQFEIVYNKDELPVDYKFIIVNEEFERQMNLDKHKILYKNLSDILPPIGKFWIQKFNEHVLKKEPARFTTYSNLLDKHFNINLYFTREEYLAIIITDISIQKKAEEKLLLESRVNKLLVSISKKILEPKLSLEEIAEIIYNAALELTQSSFGYVSTIDPINQDLVSHTLSKMMRDKCNLLQKEVRFKKEENGYKGLWGHSLNTKLPFFTNTPSKHHASTGLPKGHIKLENFLSVPAIAHGELVGQISLANSKKDYSMEDIELVEKLANIYSLAIYRKQFEETIKENEEKFKKYIESSPLGIFMMNKKGEFKYVNRTATEMINYSQDELLNIGIDILVPLENKIENQYFLSCLIEKGRVSKKCNLITKNKEIKTIKIDAVKLGNDQFLSFFTDITEQEKAGKELNMMHERLNMALEVGNLGWWEWDCATGDLVTANKKLNMLGYEVGEIEPNINSYINMIHPDDYEHAMQLMIKHMEGKSAGYEVEYRLKTKQGDWKWLYNRGEIVERDKDGNPIKLLGIVYDISKRKEAEIQLQKYKNILEELVNQRTKSLQLSEEKLRNIFNSTSDSIIITDLQGYLLEINNPGLQKAGIIDKRKVLNKRFKDVGLVDNDNQIYNYLKSVKHKQEASIEIRFKKNQTIKFLEVNGKLIDYECDKAILHVMRDVTERKLFEHKILKTIMETEEKERKRFAKDLHDGLGALLSGIKMYLNLIEQEELDLEKRKEFLQKAIELTGNAASNAREIANNIRPHELNQFGLTASISSLCDKIGGSGQVEIDLKTSNFSIAMNKDIELVIFRIISELINNTLKHSNSKKIHINLFNLEKEVFLIYSDNGNGFEMEKILKHEDTGMGLRNIIARVNSLNGKCAFNTIPGSGMDAILEVPLEEILVQNLN